MKWQIDVFRSENSWLSDHDHFTRRPHDRQRRGCADFSRPHQPICPENNPKIRLPVCERRGGYSHFGGLQQPIQNATRSHTENGGVYRGAQPTKIHWRLQAAEWLLTLGVQFRDSLIKGREKRPTNYFTDPLRSKNCLVHPPNVEDLMARDLAHLRGNLSGAEIVTLWP